MPLRLTILEHLLARLNLLPVPLFDTPLASGIAKVLVTACELGVFDALSQHPLTLEALAERSQCNPQGLQLLLQLLVSAGYLRQNRGLYRNSRMAQRWLTSRSPVGIAPYVIHSPDIVAIWDHLPEVVRENRQVMRMPYEENASNPETRAALARHYAGLASLAMALGGEIVNRVRLAGNVEKLLDVGGSHAAYSACYHPGYPARHRGGKTHHTANGHVGPHELSMRGHCARRFLHRPCCIFQCSSLLAYRSPAVTRDQRYGVEKSGANTETRGDAGFR